MSLKLKIGMLICFVVCLTVNFFLLARDGYTTFEVFAIMLLSVAVGMLVILLKQDLEK